MGILGLVGRLDGMIRRRQDLSPIAETVRDHLRESNAERVMAGVSPDGTPVAPLKPSTLKRRKGDGPPRAPMGRGSRVVTMYIVQVKVEPGRLTFTAGWPDFVPILDYLHEGNPRMAARPTYGFSDDDIEYVREVRRKHNLGGR